MLKFSDKKVLVVLVLLFVLAIFLWQQVLAQKDSDKLVVNFYDVGQGDAIHIREGNEDVLIDGGPDSNIIEKLDQNIPLYDDKIELVVLTHPHADHITGLVHVLEKYEVEQVLCTDVFYDSKVFQEWQNLIEEKGINKKQAKLGQIVNLNKANLYVLFPDISYNNEEINNLNNSSVVTKLVYGGTSFLLTGDAEKEIEGKLVSRFENSDILESNLLKLGHHGSKTASNKEFLANVSPMFAIISADEDNKFGHPHKETLDKVEEMNINLLRTDEDGDIKCISDGENINCNK